MRGEEWGIYPPRLTTERSDNDGVGTSAPPLERARKRRKALSKPLQGWLITARKRGRTGRTRFFFFFFPSLPTPFFFGETSSARESEAAVTDVRPCALKLARQHAFRIFRGDAATQIGLFRSAVAPR